MPVTGHPDYDNNVVWRGQPLYQQSSGAYPAGGTIFFEGFLTGWPSLEILVNPTAGGFRLGVTSYTDDTKSLAVSADTFDATSNSGQLCVYELRGAYVEVYSAAVTSSPAGAGKLSVTPTRTPAQELRAIVTPQFISLNAMAIAAGATLLEYFRWATLGQALWVVPAVSPAGQITGLLEELNYDGSTAITHFATSALVAGASVTHLLTGKLLRLTLKNNATTAGSITTNLISQQQGW